MREDLLGGLKNALAKGSSVEGAITSFINAGYNEYEVREAANSITQGSLETISPKPQSLSLSSIPSSPVSHLMHGNKNITKKIIILACILLILVCALMFVVLFL